MIWGLFSLSATNEEKKAQNEEEETTNSLLTEDIESTDDDSMESEMHSNRANALAKAIVNNASGNLIEKKVDIESERIDLHAQWVVQRLRAKGYEAYLTGGCVRDLLLGIEPKDFDVATSAKPEEVRKLFRNCRLVGRRFLLAHVFFPGGKIIETATFRANPTDIQDDLPEDLLVTHDNVFGNIEDDAKRRDLTINGLFLDLLENKVLDYVGGLADLEERVIRTIGEPKIRFREDPVRMMRAIKFACRLGFEIEEATALAIREHAPEITRCAPARLQEELVRLLSSGSSCKAIQLCEETGLLQALLPELTKVMTGSASASPKEKSADESFSKEEAFTNDVSTNTYQELWDLLSAMDEVSSRDCEVSAAVAFSILLLPAFRQMESSTENERSWLDKLCVNWAQRIRLARRDQDRMRLLLSGRKTFSLTSFDAKAAGFLVRRAWFKEALLIYTIDLISKKETLNPVGMWKALANKDGKSFVQNKHSQKRLIPRFRSRRNFTNRKRPQRKKQII